MDKPAVQPSGRAKRVGSTAPRAAPNGRADGAATRDAILRAARDRLVEAGYANLNVRDIASAAGVNHALIGYHFHGKQQLVLAVLDEYVAVIDTLGAERIAMGSDYPFPLGEAVPGAPPYLRGPRAPKGCLFNRAPLSVRRSIKPGWMQVISF